MKVVLFCGGLGTRLREHSDTIPKALVNIGYRPIIWHLMRYYAYFGHKEFVLCLGYRGDLVKQYFLEYSECLSNDFTLRKGGAEIELLSEDIKEWEITFVDTGLHSTIGERLLAVKNHLKDEDVFLANYADGLSDLPLNVYLTEFKASGAIAGLASVRSGQSFHAVHTDGSGLVTEIGRVSEKEFWINGGFFVLTQPVFEVLKPGEELVEEAFDRLIARRGLFTYQYNGFWKNMDTFKDKITYDRMYARGEAPWELWRRRGAAGTVEEKCRAQPA